MYFFAFFCIFFELIHVFTKKQIQIKSRMNQISNESNLEWIKSWMNQISNAKSNLDFDATFVESVWHLRRIPFTTLVANYNVSKIRGDTFGILGILFQDLGGYFRRVKSDRVRHLSRITRSAKYAKILSGFWGYSQDLGGLSGFWRFSMILFMFEYTLDIIFDRSIIKWHQLTDIKQYYDISWQIFINKVTSADRYSSIKWHQLTDIKQLNDWTDRY